MLPIINGKGYDWADITIFANAVAPLLDVTGIDYSSTQETTPQYGRGNKPRRYGRGNWSGSGKLKMQRSESDKFIPLLAATSTTGRMYDHAPFPIVVAYAPDIAQPPSKDELLGVRITGHSLGVEQGATEVIDEFDFVILGGIKRNGVLIG